MGKNVFVDKVFEGSFSLRMMSVCAMCKRLSLLVNELEISSTKKAEFIYCRHGKTIIDEYYP